MNLVRKDASTTNTTGEIPAGGLPAGTLVPSRNVVGRTDGLAVAAGMVGEVITATLSGKVQSSPTQTTWYDDPGTLTLTPGRWQVNASISGYLSLSAGSSANVAWLNGGILRDGTIAKYAWMGSNATANYIRNNCFISIVVDIAPATTSVFKNAVSWQLESGSVGTVIISTSGTVSSLYAVRIA